ncbi:MAG TPA: hypothetical protein VH599_07205 [Ktedonobacterales bacterium]|jgi:threonine dehydratase
MQPVTFADVLRAQRRLRPHLAPTPLHSYPALNAFIGAQVYINDNWTPIKFRFSLGSGETQHIVVHEFSCWA